MKKVVQKDWKDILWEKMSEEEKEKENIFNQEDWPAKKAKNNLA